MKTGCLVIRIYIWLEMHFLLLFSSAAKPEDIFIKLLGIQKFEEIIDSFCLYNRHVCQVNIIFCVDYTQR